MSFKSLLRRRVGRKGAHVPGPFLGIETGLRENHRPFHRPFPTDNQAVLKEAKELSRRPLPCFPRNVQPLGRRADPPNVQRA